MEALHTFGIELAGRAAAKAASLPADDAFSSIADYLRTKVCMCMTCWHHFLQQEAKAYSYPAMFALQALILSYCIAAGTGSNTCRPLLFFCILIKSASYMPFTGQVDSERQAGWQVHQVAKVRSVPSHTVTQGHIHTMHGAGAGHGGRAEPTGERLPRPR